MRRAVSLLGAVLFAISPACGDDDGFVIDGSPDDASFDGSFDASFDATVSSVIVTPDCTGITDVAVQLSTNGNNEFTIDGVVGSTIAIAAGDVVRFSTTGDHNFESVPGASAAFVFRSGVPGAHVACLQFTAATNGPIGYECDPHAGDGMVGTLTVD